MTKTALVKLLLATIWALKNKIIPGSMYLASLVYSTIRNLPEMFRSCRLSDRDFLVKLFTFRHWCSPRLYRFLWRPYRLLCDLVPVILRVRNWFRRAAARCPVWLSQSLRWLRGFLVDTVVIVGGAGLVAWIWCMFFLF